MFERFDASESRVTFSPQIGIFQRAFERNRVAFSLDTFFWQGKRKYLAKGEIFAFRCNRRSTNDASKLASRRINDRSWHIMTILTMNEEQSFRSEAHFKNESLLCLISFHSIFHEPYLLPKASNANLPYVFLSGFILMNLFSKPVPLILCAPLNSAASMTYPSEFWHLAPRPEL